MSENCDEIRLKLGFKSSVVSVAFEQNNNYQHTIGLLSRVHGADAYCTSPVQLAVSFILESDDVHFTESLHAMRQTFLAELAWNCFETKPAFEA